MRYNEVNDKSESTGEMNTPTLETERLISRKFIENDIEAMYQLNFDERKDRVYKKYWDNSNIHFVETDI